MLKGTRPVLTSFLHFCIYKTLSCFDAMRDWTGWLYRRLHKSVTQRVSHSLIRTSNGVLRPSLIFSSQYNSGVNCLYQESCRDAVFWSKTEGGIETCAVRYAFIIHVLVDGRPKVIDLGNHLVYDTPCDVCRGVLRFGSEKVTPRI